jgi:Fe-S-cluster-containing dehydrogenase component
MKDAEKEVKENPESSSPGLTRRDFIIRTGTAVAGGVIAAAAAGCAAPPTEKVVEVEKEVTRVVTKEVPKEVVKEVIKEVPVKVASAKAVIEYDPDYCVGCGACEYFCSTYHEGATSLSLSRITMHRYPPSVVIAVETCRQCNSPECMDACPVEGAMYVDEKTGARCINGEKCIGCGLCAEACLFNEEGAVIKYNAEKRVYVKCDLCTAAPEGPACVEACKWGALAPKEL